MFSSTANFRPATWLVLPVFLVAGGWVLRTGERPVAAAAPVRAEQWLTISGSGVPAMLGGLRSVLAGGFWLQANLAWERRDSPRLRMMIESTVAADERPAYFWLNGARMFAYDVPTWLPADAPEVVRRNVTRAETDRALQFLEKGLRWHGPDAALYVELANLHLRQRGDLETAARYYRLAAEQPGAPYYAARIHGELLRQLGRPEEALAWLKGVMPGLPPDDPMAQRAIVEARIRSLEAELKRK